MTAEESRAEANLRWARLLVDEFCRGGVRHFAISPGSRSTPLAWAVAEAAGAISGGSLPAIALSPATERIRVTVHIDERSAAFCALGHGRVSGRPSVLICTSGTAGANYLPAVIEAHYGRVPLIALTADRPAELRDSGAWQTIDQQRLFGVYARWFVDLPSPVPGQGNDELLRRYVRGVADRAVATAAGRIAGPVHLNVPFREPLGPPASAIDLMSRLEGSTTQILAPQTATAAVTSLVEPGILNDLADRIASEPRGVILAGPTVAPLRHGAAWATAVTGLAEAAGWPILAEPTSGLRWGDHPRRLVIAGYDAALRHEPWRRDSASAPGMVLRLGSTLTWKHVAQWLSENPAAYQVVVDPEDTWDDPPRTSALRVPADSIDFVNALRERVVEQTARVRRREAPNRAWLAHWTRMAEHVAQARAESQDAGCETRDRTSGDATFVESAPAPVERAVSTAPFHDAIVRTLPSGCLIWVANSMAVRDLDSFTGPSSRSLVAQASRGAAGIDGTLSTAIGAAMAHGGPTCLVTGDLAFLHDINGLGVRGTGESSPSFSLLVVVFDDGGGGIFEYLPVSHVDRQAFEDLFTTPTGADLAAACRMYGVPYTKVSTAQDLVAAIEEWHGAGGIRVVGVPIDRSANTAAHLDHWRRVAEALDVDLRSANHDDVDLPR